MEQLISLLLGTFSPNLIAFLNANVENKKYRYLISSVVCIIIGGIASLYNKEFNVESLIANMAIAFAASQTYYKVYFKDKLGRMGFNK